MRIELKHQIVDPHCEETGVLRTWQLHPEVADLLAPVLADPGLWPRRVGTLSRQAQLVPENVLSRLIEMLPDQACVLVVPTALRRVIRDALHGHHSRLTILCWEEIPSDYGVLCERLIRSEDLLRATSIRRPHYKQERVSESEHELSDSE